MDMQTDASIFIKRQKELGQPNLRRRADCIQYTLNLGIDF